ncbi:hypothetical protein, partial [Anaerobaca lacustris]|nr:HEPN domain-containing protein [Sedimentisphaerales bacterium M17dextr]
SIVSLRGNVRMTDKRSKVDRVTYVPLQLAPSFALPKRRWILSPGLSLVRLMGPLKRELDSEMSRVIPRPNVRANYTIEVCSTEYDRHIRRNLVESGKAVPSTPEGFDPVGFDAPSSAQMVLTAMLLQRDIRFAIGGAYGFALLPDGRRDPHDTYLDMRLLDSMPGQWRRYHPNRSKGPLDRKLLSQTIGRLEPYYRPITWEIDRLAVALKHFWEAFTTERYHQNFISLTVLLEALLTTRDIEVTHLIAERAACLVGGNGADRVQTYRDVRRIYADRSKIVHGRSVPKRGPIDLKNVLVISPKMNLLPDDVHRKLVCLSVKLLNALLVNEEYLEIVRSGNSEDTINKNLDEFFIKMLLK